MKLKHKTLRNHSTLAPFGMVSIDANGMSEVNEEQGELLLKWGWQDVGLNGPVIAVANTVTAAPVTAVVTEVQKPKVHWDTELAQPGAPAPTPSLPLSDEDNPSQVAPMPKAPPVSSKSGVRRKG
jgi:hypothetical protein